MVLELTWLKRSEIGSLARGAGGFDYFLFFLKLFKKSFVNSKKPPARNCHLPERF